MCDVTFDGGISDSSIRQVGGLPEDPVCIKERTRCPAVSTEGRSGSRNGCSC